MPNMQGENRMQKPLRSGFTTGTCAAAAARGAAACLLGEKPCETATIFLPDQTALTLPIAATERTGQGVCCAVKKDSGDDPDITNGVLVYACVSKIQRGFAVEGGAGIGHVTRQGLACPVGSAAINPVPREMIAAALAGAADEYAYHGGLRAVISIPGGEALAARTYNPRLGIVGGLSVLGTSGIVEPMSEAALIATIKAEMRVLRAEGEKTLVVSPGSYGAAYLKNELGLDIHRAVKCSNFIGETLDSAAELGFSQLLLVGHAGKLIKLAGGVMNTHSSVADCRFELLGLFASLAGADSRTVRDILCCVTTDEAAQRLKEAGILETTFSLACERIEHYLALRMGGRGTAQAVVFSQKYGVLGQTSKACLLMAQLRGTKENG